ncbi:MAG: hypothetical protein ACI846_000035 [Pseudoalteromonas distincta]|jgi:hypothetical protein
MFSLSVVFIGFFNLLVSLLSGVDLIQASRLLNFFIVTLVGSVLICNLLDELSFHRYVVVASVFQCIFVFLTYVDQALTISIYQFVDVSHNFVDTLERAPGLSTSGGASLSVVIALGAFSICRLSQLKYSWWHLPILLVIISANFIVARTGVILSLVALLFYLFMGSGRRFDLKNTFALLLLVIFALPYILERLSVNEQFSYTSNWALSMFNGEDKTLSVLLHQGMPDLSAMQFIFGGGGVTLLSGSNASGSDIGYIQSLFAMGIPMTLIFYLSFMYVLVKINKNDNLFSLPSILIFLMFVIEFKEPFIFKYSLPLYVCSFLMLKLKSEDKKNHE